MKNPNSSSSIPHSPARNGQSLVEAMVAITALTVSFLGISSLLTRSLVLNKVTTNELTATYLASEGIEIAKNLIDHDVHAPGTGWGTCFQGRVDFELDYTTTNCSALSGFNASHYLLYDANQNLYGYESGSPTTFTREIIVNNPTGYEIQVGSIVRWSSSGGTQSVYLQDDFYNWAPSTP